MIKILKNDKEVVLPIELNSVEEAEAEIREAVEDSRTNPDFSEECEENYKIEEYDI